VAAHFNHSSSDKAGADAVRDKVERLLKERAELRGRWRANSSALKDAVAAGRLFGVEIELPSDIDELAGVPRVRLHERHPDPATQKNLFEASGDLTIRTLVLDFLKRAGDEGAKSSQMRQFIERATGRKLHDKTIGMTLYRLAERGLARRQGFVWYYVPQPGTNGNPGARDAGAKERA
jgi:hypothetical protein